MARYRLGVPVDGLFAQPVGALGSSGIPGHLVSLFAVIFYYSEAGDRKKQKHYQAWQVIDTAQAKGGNGGRIEALPPPIFAIACWREAISSMRR
jgi:hypothetical protein